LYRKGASKLFDSVPKTTMLQFKHIYGLNVEDVFDDVLSRMITNCDRLKEAKGLAVDSTLIR
jgi:hypothetical protein